jgi:hypothetical protein
MASIVGYTPAHPFCPMQVPNAAARLAFASPTPSFFCASMVSGTVAALLLELNAKNRAGDPALR